MHWLEDRYHQMVSQKLSDALNNMNYYKKEFDEAKAVYLTIERQLKDYEKLVRGDFDDRSTLEGTST